jgi:hypothetical protein
MATFKVVWEIQVEAANPLTAAMEARDIMKDFSVDNSANQFYVQEEGKPEVFSVDLDEPMEDAVLPVPVYHAMIQQ